MIRLVAAMVVIVMVLGLVGRMDHDDAVQAHDTYCEMVAKWSDEEARGVPELERTGWPPYDGECDGNQ